MREYFPKDQNITPFSEAQIQVVVDKLNHQPHKCLNWKTHYEVTFDKVLQLV